MEINMSHVPIPTPPLPLVTLPSLFSPPPLFPSHHFNSTLFFLSSFPSSQKKKKMADRSTTTTATRPPRSTTTTTTPNATLTTYLRNLHTQSPNSTQLLGILTLIISGGILLVLTGLTLTVLVLGFIFFAPVLLLSSPLWLPVATVLSLAVFGFLSFVGFGVGAVAALSWAYRYYRGFHPPGSDGFDYARSRIATTAREVKDYAREYGGFLHTKVKDVAPGA
ncbi:hypothetical protein RND81_10G208600 [Saponaria officinalis]|uniref:Oleosin n=1 Tax=Saponaria officinalis TaxID=3572 RepID=A0AAW1I746_SAPOF